MINNIVHVFDHLLTKGIPVADLGGGGSRGPPFQTLFWVKKEKLTEGRNAEMKPN